MTDFLQTLLTSLTVGSTYALIALGYTMVYGILKFINFAHSDVFVLGAWTSFTAATFLLARAGVGEGPAPWWVGALTLIISMAVCAGVGWLIQHFAYRPLRKAPRLNVLITAIGVSLFMQNVGQLQWDIGAKVPALDPLKLPFGTRPVGMPALLPDMALNATTVARGTLVADTENDVCTLGVPVTLEDGRQYRVDVVRADASTTSSLVTSKAGTFERGEIEFYLPAEEGMGATFALIREPRVAVRLVDVAVFGSALALMLALEVLVFHTRFGSAMRAVSFNFNSSLLMGINVDRIVAITFVIGAALAAAAGFLNSLKYTGITLPASEIWVLLGLKAFVAAVVGGIGNIRGAVLGGFLIAAIEQFGIYYVNPDLKDVYVFGVLILVLLVRPSGLLGSTVREKV